MVTDDGTTGGIVMAPDMTDEGNLTPCGMVTWPGIKRPPVGGLYKQLYSYYMFLYRKQFIKYYSIFSFVYKGENLKFGIFIFNLQMKFKI